MLNERPSPADSYANVPFQMGLSVCVQAGNMHKGVQLTPTAAFTKNLICAAAASAATAWKKELSRSTYITYTNVTSSCICTAY